MSDADDDSWSQLWNARQAALEAILGPADDLVFHAIVPFHLGGDADVLRFQPPGMGVTYVTSELIGDESQVASDLGNYELMICLREHADWAPSLISRLAQYTTEASLNSWETMDVGPALPDGSTLSAFAFVPYAQFEFNGAPCGLLLCLGRTPDELDAYRSSGPDSVIERLKVTGVYPFTDVTRPSVRNPGR